MMESVDDIEVSSTGWFSPTLQLWLTYVDETRVFIILSTCGTLTIR